VAAGAANRRLKDFRARVVIPTTEMRDELDEFVRQADEG
jgi:hypothetical protein